jgi:hypothetical protein
LILIFLCAAFSSTANIQDPPPAANSRLVISGIYTTLSEVFEDAIEDDDTLWTTALQISELPIDSKILSAISSAIINNVGTTPDDSLVQTVLGVLTRPRVLKKKAQECVYFKT